MNCQEMQVALPALAEREGTPRVALQAAKHLSICRACAERLLQLRELNGLLDRIPEEDVPSSFARRVLRALPRKLGAGSGLVVLAALAGRGPAHAALDLGMSLAAMARGPFEAAATAVAAVLWVALDLALAVRTALAESPLFVDSHAAPTVGLPASLRLLPLLLLVAVGLSGSILAFWRSASAWSRERRHFDPSTS